MNHRMPLPAVSLISHTNSNGSYKSCWLTSGEYYVLELNSNATYLVRTIRISMGDVALEFNSST